MDFGLGLFTGVFIMWVIAMSFKAQWKRDLEKLKNFDTWKKWKDK
jgi:hypothetical protein